MVQQRICHHIFSMNHFRFHNHKCNHDVASFDNFLVLNSNDILSKCLTNFNSVKFFTELPNVIR